MRVWDNFFSGSSLWLIEILVIGFLLIALNFGLRFLIPKLSADASSKEKIIQVFSTPLKTLLWTIGIFFTLNTVAAHFQYPGIAAIFQPMRNALIILTLMWMVLRWKKHFLLKISQRQKDLHSGIDVGMFRILDRVCTVGVLLITTMVVLGIFGLNIAPLIAFGGVGAAAIGFAGKDVIGNFFGGMMLYITRPTVVGDHVLIPDRQIEGHVEDIGWYLTCIRDKDKRAVYLPNAIFASSSLINTSRRTHRRIDQQLMIRLEDLSKMELITREMTSYLRKDSEIDTHLPIHVFLEKIKEGTLEVHLSAYSLQVKETDFLRHQQTILSAFHAILESLGGKVADLSSLISFATPLRLEK